MVDLLEAKFASNEAVIGVVGLGYVGLPLVLAYSDKGFRTIGFDVDEFKVGALSAGRSYIEHIPSAAISKHVKTGILEATTDFSRVKEVDALLICVPTPLGEHFEPDLSYVIRTMEAIVPHLRPGQVLSLESTTYPGTTAEEVVPRVEERGFEVGKELFVVYSPEREDPGNPEFAGVNIPKVVGGTTEMCLNAGMLLYGAAFKATVPVRSTQIAEFTKLLENIYRAVNIGLVNELKIAADRMGIDIWEVIAAASTKPFGFKAFYPGPGLGGHCIPIDPFYLTWKAREYGVHTRFIELAGEINRQMPRYVVQKVMQALNGQRKAVNGAQILILGLSYKENVDDLRESPTFALMDELKAMGAEVSYHDPHIPEIGPTREHMNWCGLKSVPLTESLKDACDCVIIATAHKEVDYGNLANWASLIVDTRNAMAKAGVIDNPKVVKA
ncbi:MAG: nucleotide sugar dehydrogenase [Verrucomicrobiales bacterium]|nr:nucleotide sugar dehydrogenase [Verrucomicrobiales bacterium]